MAVDVSSAAIAPRGALAQLRSRSPRLVVVDAQPLLVEGVLGCVRGMLGSAVVVYAGSSMRDAVRAALDAGCECAVVGTHDGVPATEAITAFTMHGIPTIVLDERPTSQGLAAASIAGARGYLGKDVGPQELAGMLFTVLEGGSGTLDDGKGAGRRACVELSSQERRALVLYASGMTQEMVARRMGIAPSTVKHYIDRVRTKFTQAGRRARTKLELHEIARTEGWLP